MSRDESSTGVQLMRAFIAVALGLVIALSMLRPAVDVPSVRTLLPELRALAGIPCLVIRIFTGDL